MEDELAPQLGSRFKERKELVARYVCVLIAHQILWESSFLQEISNFYGFFKEVLKVLKDDINLVVFAGLQDKILE